MIVVTHEGEPVLSSCPDLCEIYEPQISRDGKFHLKILSSKDKSGRFFMGNLKLPKAIKDIPNGNYNLAVTKWFFDMLVIKDSFIKIDKNHKVEVYIRTKDGREFKGKFSLR